MFNKLLFTLPIALLTMATSFAEKVKADIPFEFSVGQKVLPAGTYTFDTDLNPGVLCVRSEDWKKSAMAIVINASDSNNRADGSIVFHRYGETYFLSQVLYSGGSGRQLNKSQREAQMLTRIPVKKEVLLASK